MKKKKRQKSPEGGSNWMDTYGDMVTLLLCFFVMLYSISSVDQAKWEQLVKSFNPDAKYVSQIVTDETADGNDDVPGGTSEDEFDELYEKLQTAVQQEGLETNVELMKGDGYTFVRFRDSVFFDGDSAVIKEGAKVILEKFGQAISQTADVIQEIQVLGHTSQAQPGKPNSVVPDRVLSAERSANVAAYLQEMSFIEPSKLVSVGYGQFRPIASFDTREDRAKNRRVEIIITKTGSVEKSLDEFYKEINQ